MKVLFFALVTLFNLATFASKAKITNVAFEDKIGEGRMIINLDKEVNDFPELLVKNNFIQVAIPGSFVWPKIEKKFSYNENFDSKLMAYQFNKELVRVRAILPKRMEAQKDRISLVLKGKKIIVNFPKGKKKNTVAAVSRRTASRSPALAPESKAALEKKDASVYDESYLEKLLKEKNSDIKVEKKDVVKKPFEKDSLKITQSATARKDSGFSITKYAGKFVGFLALVLLLFYGVVSLLKKGAFKKGKLGFLNSTKIVEVLNTTYIGPKRSLLLIRAHKQIFLVGSSEKGLHMISEVNDLNGVFKEGEKQISGSNFDSTLGQADQSNKEFKLKEFLNAGQEVEDSAVEDDTHALKAIEKEMAAAKESHKVKFSDQIKSKLKDLKPLQ